MYDYYPGGTHNFALDRAAVDAIEAALLEIKPVAIENRAFLRRTVRWMVKQGITQFIDIGSGTAHRKQYARRRVAPGPRGQSRVRRHRRHRGTADA